MSRGGFSGYLLLPSTAMYDLEFLLRLRPGLAARQCGIVVVTHLISVAMRAKREGVPCILIKASRATREPPQVDVSTTHEGRQGLLTSARARRFEAAAWPAYVRACERFPVTGMVQWNGEGMVGKLATEFAVRRGLARAYVELGNIDGKLFVDPEGVSGAALIARRPELLDNYAISDGEIETLARRLVEQDREAIPQSRNLRRVNPWYPINIIGGALMGLRAPASPGLMPRLRRQLGLMRRISTPPRKPMGRYVFLPLQVSSDTNLLLFSDHDARSAIAAADERAKALGAQLVIKPHPAERDTAALRRLIADTSGGDYLWTGADTIRLILEAEEVVTVNSTVGLTAKLLDRPVTVLGRSLYGAFSRRQAAAFVLRHLVDIDPFSDAEAGPSAIDRFLELMHLGQSDQASAAKPSPRSAIRS